MFLDPRIVALAEKYKAARDAYDAHIKQFAHPRQWNELSTAKQKEWYDAHV